MSTGLWLVSALLALVLAAALALGLWMHHPDSLRQALGLTQYALRGTENTLSYEGVRGSLAKGGRIERLEWQQAHTGVSAQGVEIELSPTFWLKLLNGQIRLQRLGAEKLTVHIAPSDTNTPMPSDWTLPFFREAEIPVRVGELQVNAGVRTVANEVVLRYGYGVDAAAPTLQQHRLAIESLKLAQGLYQGQASLDAKAPWQLKAHLDGTVAVALGTGKRAKAMELDAKATAQGHLGPQTAEMLVSATVQPQLRSGFSNAPELRAEAVLQPWAPMPLHSASFSAQRLDLSTLWPQAPTTFLSGNVHAGWSSKGGQTAPWQLSSRLLNSKHGPWSQNALPIERLELEATWLDERWQLDRLQTQALGGRVQAQGHLVLNKDKRAANAPWWKSIRTWAGSTTAQGIRPQMWDHTLDLPALDWSAQANNTPTPKGEGSTPFELHAKTAGGGASFTAWSLDLSGTWTHQNVRLTELRLQLPGAGLMAAGNFRPDDLGLELSANLYAPGLKANARVRNSTHTDGDWALTLDDLAQLQPWMHQAWKQWAPALAPWLGVRPVPEWLAKPEWRGKLDWQGQWAQAPLAFLRGETAPPSDLAWHSMLRIPTLNARWPTNTEVQIDQAVVALAGQGQRVNLTQTGLGQWGPWQLKQSVNAELALDLTPSGWSVLSDISGWKSELSHQTRPLRFRLDNPQPIRAQWLPGDAVNPQGGFKVRPGELQLRASLADNSPKITAAVHSAPATLAWDSLEWVSGQWRSTGRAHGGALGWVNAWLAQANAPRGPIAESGLSGELMLQAQWEVAMPRAQLQVRRESGDLIWAASTSAEHIVAGLQETSLDLALSPEGEVSAQLRWLSDNAGQLVADVYTRLPAPGGGDAPLSGQLRLDLPKVGLWSRLAPTGWRMSGAMQAQAQLGGTVLEPAWYGNLQMRQLALRSLLDGLEFSDGQLNATLSGQHLKIEELKIRGAGGEAGGWLTGQGHAQWQKGQTLPTMELNLQAQALRLLARADRRLTLSGQLQALLKDEQLRVDGRLAVDQALFLLPDESTPSLGEDVRIVGKTPTAAANRGGVPTTLKVALDLGNNFQIRGQGLSTYLQGQLEAAAKPGQSGTYPQLLGQINTVRGTYKAYGQTLEIEEGTVRFNGPYDNPALEILAIRPHPNQRVGVQITGNARQPVVRLYAEPDLPDVEKLAWLILGRPATGGGAEAVVLQQAAWALLGGRGKLSDGNFVRALGLDEFTLMGQSVDTNGNTSAAAITLGKRISNQLYLSYARSLAGASGTLSIFYDISQRWTLRGQAGDESGVDLIFTHKFD